MLFLPKGFLIYFAYGIRHSLEGNPRDEEDDEDVYSDNIHAATEEKSAMQANDHHQRNLSLPFIFHEKTSECWCWPTVLPHTAYKEWTMAGRHHHAGMSWVCCRDGPPKLYFLLQTASLQMVNYGSGETAWAHSSAMSIPKVMCLCAYMCVWECEC